MKRIKGLINNNNFLLNMFYRYNTLRNFFTHLFYSDKKRISKHWKNYFSNKIDFDHPKTLNEKIQWLKVNDRRDIHTLLADKFASRKYISENFGDEYLVPLLFVTDKVRLLNKTHITEVPFIVKPNNGSGLYKIYRNFDDVNWKHLRRDARTWLKRRYYEESQEWQYKNMKPLIVVEKLLTDKFGKIPNDYKLHFINGKFVFIYCAIDREGENYRNIYDLDWNLLPFSWSGHKSVNVGNAISKPKTFANMLEIGEFIAKDFAYVRVDFFEVDGKLYCGEITFHHGSGYDKFDPPHFDKMYGDLLDLGIENL